MSKKWLAILVFTLKTTQAFSSPRQLKCLDVFLQAENVRVKIEMPTNGAVLVNGVAVTGDFVFPLDFVIKNLGLVGIEDLNAYQGRSIISLGEGTSGLLPYLLNKGISARGIDLWYHAEGIPNNLIGNIMRSYGDLYGERLIQADARRTLLEDASVDVVLSHMLVNNVNLVRRKSILREVVRILKPGGEARIFGFDEEETLSIAHFLEMQFADRIRFAFQTISYSVTFRGRTHSGDMNLLILQKN